MTCDGMSITVVVDRPTARPGSSSTRTWRPPTAACCTAHRSRCRCARTSAPTSASRCSRARDCSTRPSDLGPAGRNRAALLMYAGPRRRETLQHHAWRIPCFVLDSASRRSSSHDRRAARWRGHGVAAQDPAQTGVEAQRAAMKKLDYRWAIGRAPAGWSAANARRSRRRAHPAQVGRTSVAGRRRLREPEKPGVSVHQTLASSTSTPASAGIASTPGSRWAPWTARARGGRRRLALGAAVPGRHRPLHDARGSGGEWFEIGERSADGTTWRVLRDDAQEAHRLTFMRRFTVRDRRPSVVPALAARCDDTTTWAKRTVASNRTLQPRRCSRRRCAARRDRGRGLGIGVRRPVARLLHGCEHPVSSAGCA